MTDGIEQAPPKVVLVEDEKPLADLYADWLRPVYTVEVAHDLPTAVEVLDDTVDIALLDRRLPDGSGDEILRFIRDIGLECRVAMVTAVDPGLDIIDMGFDDYLCKPITKDELHSMLRGLQERSFYQEAMDEYYTLVSKKALLETHCTDAELQASEEYGELDARQEALQQQLTSITDSFTETEFTAEITQIQQEWDERSDFPL